MLRTLRVPVGGLHQEIRRQDFLGRRDDHFLVVLIVVIPVIQDVAFTTPGLARTSGSGPGNGRAGGALRLGLSPHFCTRVSEHALQFHRAYPGSCQGILKRDFAHLRLLEEFFGVREADPHK
jgi:hypothetical protein